MGFSYIIFSFLFSALMFFTDTTQAQQNSDLSSNPRNTVIVSPYDYPIIGPLAATISYLAVRPSKNITYKTLPLDLHPERAKLPYYGKEHILKLAIFSHENKPTAPLIFIVPGIGGATLASSTLYLGEMLYNAGFNVVTLPSTLSWQFAISVSRTGLPGYSLFDAEDMLNLMKTADTILRREMHIKPSTYAIMGYSLGALDSAFIANLDLQKHFFNFNRVLMLNPPLQKDKCITSLDGLMTIAANLTETASKFENTDFFDFKKNLNFEQQIGLSDLQMSRLIGATFRKTLGEVILISQEIDDQKVLKTPSRPLLRELRRAEAYTFNFRDYINKFVFPKLKDSSISTFNFITPDDLIANSDMRIQIDLLSEHNVKWAIYHNQNDFIFQNGDLEFLFNSISDSRIYPLGGHLGNLWFEQNRQDILAYFAPLFNK